MNSFSLPLSLLPTPLASGGTPPHVTADHSRFVQRVRRRYEKLLHRLPAGLPQREPLMALIQSLQKEGQPLATALRVTRQLVLERLAVLDIENGAPMEDITQVMTLLAEVTLDFALAQARAEQDARYGPALNEQGQVIEFWIVGMGKLGARELNVSSDIDVVYVYEEDGMTTGPKKVSAHEYFSQVARSLYTLIGETSDDGWVFRVDLALRPNGKSGPPVVSLAMLEEYFQVQGREWERFAWLKSRVVAPTHAISDPRTLALRGVVTPFVYRRYLDYGVFEGLRQLHRKVREEARRRAAGRPERAHDVKLSRGGIREIEFIVQLLLIVRGGQFPEIRTRSTLKALDKLTQAGLMTPVSAQGLHDAYVLLRRIEHRIQYLDDQQTHQLPTEDVDLQWICASLGLSTTHGAATLMDLLDTTREFVANEFDALLHEGRTPEPPQPGCKHCTAPLPPVDSDSFLERLPLTMAVAIKPWVESARIHHLRDETKLRLSHLMLRISDMLEHGECNIEAITRFLDWLQPLLRREGYLALLTERPAVLHRLLRLLSMARWPMQYLMLHPSVIDELADSSLLQERFDAEVFAGELQARHDGWQRSGQADEESLLDTLRRAHHAEVFRTLVRDVEGALTVEEVADDLSALADVTLQCALYWCWQHFKAAHRNVPEFAIIAYGKLGGKELGYGGDLDVVFLFDDAQEPDRDQAAEVYSGFVRKLIGWLTLRTSAGELFDIDTALRPNGNSGLLVTSLSSFEQYQTGRGSNAAWTWEHQAITRARFCAGSQALMSRFEAIRRNVLQAPRDPQALQSEVISMREKLRRAHRIPADKFDLKRSTGGMLDIEFAVQYLVLRHSHMHSEMQCNSGNIALLLTAQTLNLLPDQVGQRAANAYREMRRAQHKARLDEKSTQCEAADWGEQREAVQALWNAAFAN
jgi:[glutamine synthetase] adenylyltransferase / [glutamine synthetase]-adenylyl-L-tyrosine phosphorylase